MDYTVSSTDTLERIAAAHDCTVGELMKLNRMASRMVFSGQKILAPNPMSDDVFDSTSIQSGTHLPVGISGVQAAADGIRKGPGGAIPSTNRGNLLKTQSAPVKTNSLDEQVDSDCLQRFLKIKVKQLTESDGTVTGTLLVTPNCLMFDPDVSHPLVRENGPDLYGMVANMEDIMSVSVYKDVGALMGDKSDKRRDIFRPDQSKTSLDNEQSLESADSQSCLEKSSEKLDNRQDDKGTQPVTFSTSLEDEIENGSYESASDEFAPRSPRISTEMQLPSITEEKGGGGKDSPQISSPVTDDLPRKRSISDGDESKRAVEEGTKGKAELQASQSFGSSAKAKSGVQTMAKGAESVAASAARGTKTVAHGVVSHTKSAADTLQTGIQTSAKVVGDSAKAAADKVAQLPENIVSKGSELIADGVNGVSGFFNVEGQQEQRTPQQMKREQSLATLEGLKQKTAVAREQAVTKAKDQPTNSRSESETDTSSQSTDLPSSPIMPFFMAVRLTRKRMKKGKSTRPSTNSSISSYDEDCAFGNRLKREFWFTIPRNKADTIYGFLLQWSPEKYGQDTNQQQTSTQQEEQQINIVSNDPIRGFIVLDSESDDALSGEKPQAPLFGTSYLNREWEIVTVKEMCRRLSLDEIDHIEMPIPEGAETSQVLDELMIRQVMEILPARAEGYPWVQIYNSEKHGFSLATLYRKMVEFDEDMSPVLLIIRDTNDHVFGAIVSSAIRPHEGYWGTGDSCLLWKFTGEVPHTRELRHFTWTGDNQFFVNAAKESLSIGAGGGHQGLWLDADLNHGRSQKCETFDNEPLAGDKEDFIIQFCEAFGFRM